MTRLLLMFLAAGTLTAQADILIEPYAGYYMGKYSGGTNSYNANGSALGARLGYQSLGFMLGADYLTGAWTGDTSPKTNFKPSYIGAFVGYNFPILLRAYAEYDVVANDVSSGQTNKGTAIKLGLGYTALPFLSINFEIINSTFTKTSIDGTDSTLSPNLTATMYGVSISLPFTI